MRKGREFYVVEVETLNGSRILNQLCFRREGAEKVAKDELAKDDALRVTVYPVKIARGSLLTVEGE
jgi:hypothetical protein